MHGGAYHDRESVIPYDGRASAKQALAVDELTGFLTRRSLQQLIDTALALPGAVQACLMKIEVARFDQISIGIGHDRADRVIAMLSQRLHCLFPHASDFARLADGRLGVLFAGNDQMDDNARLAIEFLQRPLAIDGEIIVIGVHVGVASMADVDGGSSRLLQAAAIALHEAVKRQTHYCLFMPQMLEAAAHNQALENDLRVSLSLKSSDIHEAINNAEFILDYQPIVETGSGIVRGFEALVRWNHPRLGRVSPAEFIPLAERIGVMPLLGNWIIRKAMVDAASWPCNRDGFKLRVSINLSPAQFQQPAKLLATITSALEHSGLEPSQVNFEMTESGYLADAVAPHLLALKALGCTLAIDDFGTGYSSLSMLVQLPLDFMKIDISLVRGLDSGDPDLARRSRRLMASIIGLANGLKQKSVVEGVETQKQLQLVTGLGADLIQGHVFHPALASSDVVACIQAHG